MGRQPTAWAGGHSTTGAPRQTLFLVPQHEAWNNHVNLLYRPGVDAARPSIETRGLSEQLTQRGKPEHMGLTCVDCVLIDHLDQRGP